MITKGKSPLSSEALFNNIDSILRENKLNWENYVAVGLDNTAVNVGKKNSIMTRELAKNKNVFINSCPCHIIHNTAIKAAERFSEVSGFDVEDFLVDLFPGSIKAPKEGYVKFSTVNYQFNTLSFERFLFFIDQLQYMCILSLSITYSAYFSKLQNHLHIHLLFPHSV